MSELKHIYAATQPEGKPHIIFVHGLGGHISETWMCNSKDPATLWPIWVGEETGCPVWLLGYDAAMSAWSEVAMALPQQGTNVLDTLLSEPKLSGVPLIMVGHSLGGLVIKMALANARNQGVKRYEQFAEQLKGVVFVGTPHFGSELATLVTAIRMLRPNEQVGNLNANDAYLTSLNAQFRALYAKLGFKVRVFTETRGVTIQRRILGFRIWPSKMIVAASSGDPHVPGEVAIPLPEDHFSICKPEDKLAQIYRSLIDFVKEVQDSCPQSSRLADSVPPGAAAPANKGRPTANSEIVASEAVEAWHREQIAVHVALSVYGIELTKNTLVASACVVTDEPHVLVQQVARWREQISRDPLIPMGLRTFAQSATLRQLVVEPATRHKMLAWLAVTPFSAYLYYGDCAELEKLDEATRREHLLVSPLLHRLSKKDERVVCVQSDLQDIEEIVTDALAEVKKRFHRNVEVPQISGRETRSLVDLAQLVAWATAQHLESLDDGEATTIFESLRTSIRFAQNVVTDARHIRDKNPLP